MINIGSIWIYQAVIIIIFVIGVVAGLLIKTWGQIYFVFTNLIWLLLVLGIASYVMPALEKDLNHNFVSFINSMNLDGKSKQIATGAAPVIFTIFLDFLYYGLAFIALNIITYIIYLCFLRKYFKKKGVLPRPIFVIGGAVLSFVESYFVGFFIISFAASQLFYNGTNNFKQEIIEGIDKDLNRADYTNQIYKEFKYFYPMIATETGAIYNITTALNNWFWIANAVERTDSPSTGHPKTPVPMIETFTNNKIYKTNIINLFDSLSDYSRVQFTTNLIGPLLKEWKDIGTQTVAPISLQWIDVEKAIYAYFNEIIDSDPKISAPLPLSPKTFDDAFNLFGLHRPPDSFKPNFCDRASLFYDKVYQPFCQITSYVNEIEKTPDKAKVDPIYAILKNGTSFYNLFHNFMTISNYAKDDADMGVLNDIIQQYGFKGFYMFKPSNPSDHDAMKNYNDIKIFFDVTITS